MHKLTYITNQFVLVDGDRIEINVLFLVRHVPEPLLDLVEAGPRLKRDSPRIVELGFGHAVVDLLLANLKNNTIGQILSSSTVLISAIHNLFSIIFLMFCLVQFLYQPFSASFHIFFFLSISQQHTLFNKNLINWRPAIQ